MLSTTVLATNLPPESKSSREGNRSAMMVDLVTLKVKSQLLSPGKIVDKRVVCGQQEVVRWSMLGSEIWTVEGACQVPLIAPGCCACAGLTAGGLPVIG